MMSAVVKHKIVESIIDNAVGGDGIVTAQAAGFFQLAPLPPAVGFVPRRLGFFARPNSGGSEEEDYVPLTRNSRLALPAMVANTKFNKDKAVKRAFTSLDNGEIHGYYRVEMLTADQFHNGGIVKDAMRLVLRVESPATDDVSTAAAASAASTNTAAAASQQEQHQQVQGIPFHRCVCGSLHNVAQ
jgi:hypothetical protein